MRIFVGNLSYQTTEEQLSDLFSEAGPVESATIVTDRDTGRSRGFAFIEMDKDAAAAAIEKFNGVELNGRAINVNEARPRPERNFGGSGGGFSRVAAQGQLRFRSAEPEEPVQRIGDDRARPDARFDDDPLHGRGPRPIAGRSRADRR